jgi:transcriptional repressor NrdR
MQCPKCSSDKLGVIDSRDDGVAIRRRRSCQECSYRFTTFERIELKLPLVIKKDGSRQTFDRYKVETGLVRACVKRPISAKQIEDLVLQVERKVQEIYQSEITSQELGEMISDSLRQIDDIAYIRFASVYRQFSDVQHFVEVLQSISVQIDK